ncbi:aminotransferase class I/II-fold pyridoxal phosphate-dependent enzyme [Leucobacter luti]|uniref:Arginine decarboxylase n=1 Tax=Leucobacter luti TaxID=340320 RepID=A0A4Q7TG55_9MICO|nr:aminotransferase class I/II-fold pyridoxal phosphate-dependent enzyme [Leucobacter luti]RZT59466.1 arginine decarboxylase [Leucobacter luti]
MSPAQGTQGAPQQATAPYADALAEHRDRGGLRFMIPGHATGQAGGSDRLREFIGATALELDIPQLVEGIDLGPGNAFDRARELAAAAWDAKTTWFLTNGASQGNRMAMQALAALGDRVLVQRSCHSSVYDGLVMSGATPEYLFPDTDPEHGIAHGITAAAAERALAAAAAAGTPFAALVLVSPSYFGVVADIPAVAAACHRHGAVLVVDGSWGAHFGFHPELPESPTRQGADIVLSSIHKLGGSLTQTAFLHLCDTPRAGALEPALEAAYRLTESTSLNSLLLASLDIARSELATGHAEMGAALASAAELRRLVAAAPGLRLAEPDFATRPGVVAIDPLHVSLDVRGRGVTGPELKTRLARAEPPVFVEIAAPTSIVALIGPRGTPDVAGLLRAIDRVAPPLAAGPARGEGALSTAAGARAGTLPAPPPGERVFTPRAAYLAPSESVPAAAAVGRISAAMLAAYPPGIPNAVPGERLTPELIDYLTTTAQLPGSYIRGAVDPEVSQLRVLRED